MHYTLGDGHFMETAEPYKVTKEHHLRPDTRHFQVLLMTKNIRLSSRIN